MWHVWLQMSSKGGHETIQMCHLWQKLFSNRCHEQTCVNSSWGKEIHANVNYVANALLKSLKSTNIWHQFIKEIIKSILKFDKSSRILLVYLLIIPVRTFYYMGLHPVLPLDSKMHEDISCRNLNFHAANIWPYIFKISFNGFRIHEWRFRPTTYILGCHKVAHLHFIVVERMLCSLNPSQAQRRLFRVIVWSLWTVFSLKKR